MLLILISVSIAQQLNLLSRVPVQDQLQGSPRDARFGSSERLTAIPSPASPDRATGPRMGNGIRSEEAAQYGWESSYEDAKVLAWATGKPLMIVLRCVP